MRTSKTFKKAMELINITGETKEEKAREMLERMEWDAENEEPERVDYMNAYTYGGRTLKSYSTLVAYFDGVNVYELGSYSRTTSKQVSRFAEYHGADVIRISNPLKMLEALEPNMDHMEIANKFHPFFY